MSVFGVSKFNDAPVICEDLPGSRVGVSWSIRDGVSWTVEKAFTFIRTWHFLNEKQRQIIEQVT